MNNEMEIKVRSLRNGMKLVWQYSESQVAHCGLMIGAGSRHEPEGKAGLAHFIEHVLFKGTKKRKAWQVLTRLDAVGGELNAYTTREETCIHASFIYPHLERSVELIADIVLHATFPVHEIEKEKEVVIDEILSCLDNPIEQIYDDFEGIVFDKHPLGTPVLGTNESVKSFSQKDIKTFVNRYYHASNFVFSYTGPHHFNDVFNLAERYFAAAKPGQLEQQKNIAVKKVPANIIKQIPLNQSHLIMGGKAYGYKDKRRYPMFLLNNILGGPGMNSRLNMNIREKYGFTYHIESGFNTYFETGLFTIYLATEKSHLEKTRRLVDKELKKLREQKINQLQLSRYIAQIKGQLAIAQEHKVNVMLANAKSVLNYGKAVAPEIVMKHFDEITAAALMEAANEVFDPMKMGSLLYAPLN